MPMTSASEKLIPKNGNMPKNNGTIIIPPPTPNKPVKNPENVQMQNIKINSIIAILVFLILKSMLKLYQICEQMSREFDKNTDKT